MIKLIWQVEQKPGGRGRGREWTTLGVHPLSWLLSNNRLEKVSFVSVPHTSSNRLLLSNQDKGCTPSVAHSLALPLGPALLNLWILKPRCVANADHLGMRLDFKYGTLWGKRKPTTKYSSLSKFNLTIAIIILRIWKRHLQQHCHAQLLQQQESPWRKNMSIAKRRIALSDAG